METYGATLAVWISSIYSAMDFHKIWRNFCPCENCIFIQAAGRNSVEIRCKLSIFKIQSDISKKTSIHTFPEWENGGKSIKLSKDSCEHITESISCPPGIDSKPQNITVLMFAVWSPSLVFLRSWTISLLFLSYFSWDVNDLCPKVICTLADFFTITLLRSMVKCEKTHTSNLDLLLTFSLFS